MKVQSEDVLGLFDPVKINVTLLAKKTTIFKKYFIYKMDTEGSIVLDERFTNGLKMSSTFIIFSNVEISDFSESQPEVTTEPTRIDLYLPKNGDIDNIESKNLVFLGKGFVQN